MSLLGQCRINCQRICVGFILLLLYNAAAQAALPNEAQITQIMRTTAAASRLNATAAQSNPTTSITAPTQQEQSVGYLTPAAAKVTFVLKKITLSGAQALTAATLTAPYQSYLGKIVALGDIETMAHDMTLRYQKAGYVLTRVIIPPQHIGNGEVNLRVVEGYIDKIYVQGDVQPAVAALLKRYGDQIRATRPLQIKNLERYALLANDLSGITARVVLSPSQSALGAADLTFVVQQQTTMVDVAADNRGTKFLGPQQITLGTQLSSTVRAGDTTNVEYLTTGDRALNFLQLMHSTPLGADGLRLNLSGAYTRALPGATLQQLEIVGRSVSTETELAYPLIRSRQQNLTVHGGVGTLNSDTTVLQQNLYSDRVRFLQAGADYSRSDHWLGLNEMAAELTQGLALLGASHADTADISRPDATPKFTKYTMNLSRLQKLPSAFSLLVAGQGQYTHNPLYAAEQFGFGGSSFGRGYDPAELTGDRGLAGKIELRYDLASQQQLYAFYDIGSVWNIDTQLQPAKLSAASAGIGTRLNFSRWLSGNVEIDKPLTSKVNAVGNRDWRVYLGLTLSDTKTYKAPTKVESAPIT